MSYNSFDYYNQIRQYQLHLQKVANPQTKVPKHEAFKPYKPNIQRAKEYQRNRRIEQIERQNEQIMSKLLNINKRGMQISKSSSSLSLPKIKKQVNIPLYEQENNQIARRIIQSKSNINTLGMIDRYRSVEQRKKNISKYHTQDGVLVNRKKYLAQLMLLKKMRVSEVMANSK